MAKALYNKLIEKSKSKIKNFLKSYSTNIINEEASIFIGAGLSMNSGMPNWSKLLYPCIEQLNIKNTEGLNLFEVAQYYSNEFTESQFRKIINEQVNCIYDSNPVLEKILKIKFKSIWTTNYDKLIELELRKNRIPHNTVTNEKNLTQISNHDKVNLYKINGDIDNPKEMILTQNDYEHYEQNHSLFLTFLKKELVSNNFLFVGYSFNDQIILNCLSTTMNLLDGVGNTHYALMVIDSNVSVLSEYKANDLKLRYNIECIFIDKNDLVGLFNELTNRVKAKKVFISGAYYNVTQKTDLYADKISKTLVTYLLKNGNRISTGIGRRLGTYVTGYANQYLAEHSIGDPLKYLSMRPFPFHLPLSEQQTEEYRTYMQHDCSCAIFMFGQSEHTYKKSGYNKLEHYSEGVYQEFLIAQKLGLKIIPIGSTGYEAKIICNEVKENINRFPYLSKKIDFLMTETEPERLSEIVVSIVNQAK